MKIKTEELEGLALDYYVALAAYPLSKLSGDRLRVRAIVEGEEFTIGSVFLGEKATFSPEFSPRNNWAQAGYLLKEFAVSVKPITDATWEAEEYITHRKAIGVDTKESCGYLVAAMRVVVLLGLGEQVEELPKC